MSKEEDLSPERIAAARDIISTELTLLPYDKLLELFQQSPDFISQADEPLTEIDFITQIIFFGEEQVEEADDETKLMLGVLVMEAMFDNLESLGQNPVRSLVDFIAEHRVELTDLKIEDKQELIGQMIAQGWKFGVLTHWLVHLRVLKSLEENHYSNTEWFHKFLFAYDICSEYKVVELRENSEMLLLLK